MKTYGETIRYFRKSKGLLLKELVDDDLSISLLSQFETNKTTISCERFHRLLDKMEIRFDEFKQVQMGDSHTETEKYILNYCLTMHVISKFDHPEALNKQLSLLTKELRSLNQYIKKNYSLQLDHFIQLATLDLQMKKKIFSGGNFIDSIPAYRPIVASASAYLLNTETWGVYELRLFSRISVSLAPEIIWQYINLAIKKSASFHSLAGNQHILHETLITVFTVYCALNETTHMNKVLKLMADYTQETYRNPYALYYPFFLGWSLCRQGNYEDGIKNMDQTLQILHNFQLKKEYDEFTLIKKTLLDDINVPIILILDALFLEEHFNKYP